MFTVSSVILNLVTSTDHRNHVIRKLARRPWFYIPWIKKYVTMILDSPKLSIELKPLLFWPSWLLPIFLMSEDGGKKNRIHLNNLSRNNSNRRPSPNWPWKGLSNLDDYNPGQKTYWKNDHCIEYGLRDDLPFKLLILSRFEWGGWCLHTNTDLAFT